MTSNKIAVRKTHQMDFQGQLLGKQVALKRAAADQTSGIRFSAAFGGASLWLLESCVPRTQHTDSLM